MQILDHVVAKSLNEFEAECGVKIRTRKVKLSIVRAAWAKLERPKVPQTYIEELGRMEENPSDPEYLEACSDYAVLRGELARDAYFAFGSDPSFIPEGMPRWDEPGWENDLAEFGIEVPKEGRHRYVAWLNYVVLDSQEEINELQRNIMRMSGIVLEADVKAEEDSFPNQ